MDDAEDGAEVIALVGEESVTVEIFGILEEGGIFSYKSNVHAYIQHSISYHYASITKHIFVHTACIHMQTNIPYHHICVPCLDLYVIGEQHQLMFVVCCVSEHGVCMTSINMNCKERTERPFIEYVHGHVSYMM